MTRRDCRCMRTPIQRSAPRGATIQEKHAPDPSRAFDYAAVGHTPDPPHTFDYAAVGHGTDPLPAFDYVAVGHVTVDELVADGTRRPGGSAFYSALQAARLGMRALIITRGVPAEVEELLAPYRGELELEVLPAERTTTLRTWGDGHARRQRLLAWAGPIEGPIEVDTAILHLAPVARETPHGCFGAHPPRAGFVGLTPQGLVREWDAEGEIALVTLTPELVPQRCDAWVLSERERECCAESIEQAVTGGAVVAVTAGALPTTLHLPGASSLPSDPQLGDGPHLGDEAVLHVPVPPLAQTRDDLGAGDVFAAAFFVALREGRSPAVAAAFANAAAAVRITGDGLAAIGDRAAIETQLGIPSE
jgi:sugar/nucleoside kinase (ribokinase family)